MAEDQSQPDRIEPDRMSEIRQNIVQGEKWLKTGNYAGSETRWEMWERNADYLRCDWSHKKRFKDMGDDDLDFHTNIARSNYQTKMPNLIFRSPHVEVEAKQPEFVRDEINDEPVLDDFGMPQIKSDNFLAANMMQIMINHEQEQQGIADVVKRCVSHSMGYYGIGWAKTGYSTTSLSQFNNDRDNDTNFWTDWVDARDVVFDWRANDPKRMRWVAHRLVLPKQDVLDGGLKLPPDFSGKIPEHFRDRETNVGGDLNMRDHPGHFVEFWEYHDLEEDSIDWILLDGPGTDWFFMDETSVEPYPFEGSSLIPLVLDPVDDDIIGLTDIQQVEDHIRALNRMRNRQVWHIDNFGTGVIMEENAMTQNQEKNYKRTPYGWFLKLKRGFFNKFKTVGTPSMGSDNYNMSEIMKEEVRTQLHITDYQQGGADITRKATEAQIIRSDAALSIESTRDIISKFYIEIIRRQAAMFQEFATEPMFYNVARDEFDDDFIDVLKQEYGYNPKLPFLGLNRDRIQGEFDYKFNIEEMIHQPREVRAAQLARSLQGLAALGDSAVAKFAENNDLDEVINDMFELNGVKIKKYEKTGPAMIPAVVENMMFQAGKEVPDPHAKDDDDEHNLAHDPLRRELEVALVEVQNKTAKIQQGMQMIPEMMALEPVKAQAVQEAAQAQLEQLLQQQGVLEKRLRKVKLHMQEHVKQGARKAGAALGPSPAQQQAAAAAQAQQGNGAAQPAQPATPAEPTGL